MKLKCVVFTNTIGMLMKTDWYFRRSISAMNADQFDNLQDYSGGNTGNPHVTVYPEGQRYNAQNNCTVVVDKPNYPWCTLVTSFISFFFCTVGEDWWLTKWPTFCRGHFNCIFIIKIVWFEFTETCSQLSNWHKPNAGSDNGLAPKN